MPTHAWHTGGPMCDRGKKYWWSSIFHIFLPWIFFCSLLQAILTQWCTPPLCRSPADAGTVAPWRYRGVSESTELPDAANVLISADTDTNTSAHPWFPVFQLMFYYNTLRLLFRLKFPDFQVVHPFFIKICLSGVICCKCLPYQRSSCRIKVKRLWDLWSTILLHPRTECLHLYRSTMEDLLSSLGGIEVTSYPNNPHAEHPHFALYKAKATGSSQDERRKMVLQARKEWVCMTVSTLLSYSISEFHVQF